MTETIHTLQAYTQLEKLSVHQHREVFKARNQAGDWVIIKRLQMGYISDWKAMELFEREARVLQSLEHPRIPRLLDFFYAQVDCQVVLTMVMEYVEGLTLAERLQMGWRPLEAEVLEIARQGLELLAWLHERQPVMIHRDIKPSNLIWSDHQQLYLIDFGAVKELFLAKGSSTVIGTFGYMAPEQFIGQSVPASDLYGLATTLLHLLSGKAPAEIPQQQLKLDFRPFVSCSLGLQRLLEHWLEPDLTDRPEDVRSALVGLESLTRQEEISPGKRMVLITEGESLSIRLYPHKYPLAVCLQHKLLLALMGVFLGSHLYFLNYLFELGVSWEMSQADNIVWLGFLAGYALCCGSIMVVLFLALRTTAKESLLLQLASDGLTVTWQAPWSESVFIPREAIQGADQWLRKPDFRLKWKGVCLLLHQSLIPQLNCAYLDLARSLGKRDQHWLITKILQYGYQSSDALKEFS